jgi:hypothetical protein
VAHRRPTSILRRVEDHLAPAADLHRLEQPGVGERIAAGEPQKVDRGVGVRFGPIRKPLVFGTGRYETSNTRVVIDVCKPWARRETFPIVARTSKELEEKIRAKWARDLPPGG